MSDERPQRRSTGGLPPVRVLSHFVAEEAPSHDNTPCASAWVRYEIAQVPSGWELSDFPVYGLRPKAAFEIYDTRPQSGNLDHLKTLADTFNRETDSERGFSDDRPTRIDVWGMPLATSTTDKERISTCKSHSLSEIAFRNGGDNPDFPVPGHKGGKWQRAIIIIDRSMELWDEGEGGFLVVCWDLTSSYLNEWRSLRFEGDPLEPATASVFRTTRKELGSTMLWLNGGL